MALTVPLETSDGFALDAFRAEPRGPVRGGLVVIQENAGITPHIGDLCDSFAAEGYLSIAPALYDRVGKNLVFGYSSEALVRRRATRDKVDVGKALLDVGAAVAAAARGGKVGVIGYCWGGSISWLAAARVAGLDCAVSYYGTGITTLTGERPRCPVLLHWGASDPGAPPEEVRKVEAAHPDARSYVYDAGHAFNNPHTKSYSEAAASLARGRTLRFLREHLG